MEEIEKIEKNKKDEKTIEIKGSWNKKKFQQLQIDVQYKRRH